MGLYIGLDLLVATLTASACSLIDPFMGYEWICTWVESVDQNCVRDSFALYSCISLFSCFVRCRLHGMNLFNTRPREIGGVIHSLT